MRPIPQNRHLVAVTILVAAAALAGYLAAYDNDISGSQVNIAAAALKRHDPDLFRHDPIFGSSRLWLFHTPAYQGMLELILVPTQYKDPLMGFRVGAAVQTLLLLCGMYALLFWQTRSWSVSVFVAVLSARLIEMPGGGYWGSGPLESVTPGGLCLAAWPLVVLTFARHSRPEPHKSPLSQWRVILVFVVVGLLGNFHLVTAMNMTLVLLIAYVIRQRFRLRCLPIALASGAAAAVAALPYIWYYFSLRAQMTAGHPAPAAATLMQAIDVGDLSVFYPELLKSLLDWRVLAGVIVLGIPAAAVLVKIERYITQHVRLWLGLIIGSLVVAMGMHGISQSIGKIWHIAPPVIDFIQAAELLMLPLYVLLGQAITNLFRLLRTHRTLLRWILAALLAAWMIPSDNLRMARRNLAEIATSVVSEEDKPDYVLKHREQDARHAELAAIAGYAATRPDSMYITDHGEFRILARRPIVAAPSDVRYLYYLAPWRLAGWLDRYEKQEELLGPPAGTADGEAVAQFVAGLTDRQPGLAEVNEWYLVLRAPFAPSSPGPLQPITNENWGRHYRLYRIR